MFNFVLPILIFCPQLVLIGATSSSCTSDDGAQKAAPHLFSEDMETLQLLQTRTRQAPEDKEAPKPVEAKFEAPAPALETSLTERQLNSTDYMFISEVINATAETIMNTTDRINVWEATPAPAPYSVQIQEEKPTMIKPAEKKKDDKKKEDDVWRDCEVGEWSRWGMCGEKLSGMKATYRIRWRPVVSPALKGGAQCPPLQETEICSTAA